MYFSNFEIFFALTGFQLPICSDEWTLSSILSLGFGICFKSEMSILPSRLRSALTLLNLSIVYPKYITSLSSEPVIVPTDSSFLGFWYCLSLTSLFPWFGISTWILNLQNEWAVAQCNYFGIIYNRVLWSFDAKASWKMISFSQEQV